MSNANFTHVSPANPATLRVIPRHEPKTKADLLDRMLQADFSGDLRDLAPGRNLTLKRSGPNTVKMMFLDSGRSFQLVIRKPRSVDMLVAARRRKEERGVKRMNASNENLMAASLRAKKPAKGAKAAKRPVGRPRKHPLA